MSSHGRYKPDIAVILVNLGTPEAPTPVAVRRYLREFLSDRRVVEAPRLIWWLVLNLIVLVRRPRPVAKLYESIWTSAGSPLRVLTNALAERVAERISDPRVRVYPAMTYGTPSLRTRLEQLQVDEVKRVLVVPLYPQYSATTSGAVVDIVARYLLQTRRAPDIRIVRDYCERPDYLAAVAQSIRQHGEGHATLASADRRLLFSFHGIPQAYAERGDPYPECCAASARGIASQLGLPDDAWEIVFQSRFGRQPWLQPYLDKRLDALPSQGVKSVLVVCPGFATDCLETLEEVAEQNREGFLQAGGEQYEYVPALNDSPAHADMIAGLVREHIAGW
jgi:ferrochelatase